MSSAPKKILIADDDNIMVTEIATDLKNEGFSILTANDGVETLEEVTTNKPDLIILDIMMPGMNGQEVCRQVKENPETSHIPIIMLTARHDEKSKEESFGYFANAYVTKPFTFEKLQGRVKELLEHSKSDSQTPPISSIKDKTKEMEEEEYVIRIPHAKAQLASILNNTINDFHFKGSNKIIDSSPHSSLKLMKLSSSEVESLKSRVQGLIIEPNVKCELFQHPIMNKFVVDDSAYLASGTNKLIIIEIFSIDNGSEILIKDAKVYFVSNPKKFSGPSPNLTNDKGQCSFIVSTPINMFEIIVIPRSGYWSRVVKNLNTDDIIDNKYRVRLSPLEISEEKYDWGHSFAGMQDGLAKGGSGVKIGIIDSGIAQHPDLLLAGGETVIQDKTKASDSPWNEDEIGHGTQVAGIIASIINNRGIKGYTPKAEIYSYRVVAKGELVSEYYDIIDAVGKAVQNGCNIINLSLGLPPGARTKVLQAEIEEAHQEGTLCIAATGNNEGEVWYPARFENVVGVGAFGKFGVYPSDSLHKGTESTYTSDDNKYFRANFSNFGEGLNFYAPGVAITSTIDSNYTVGDGTSFACPQVTGIAALIFALFNLSSIKSSHRVDQFLKFLDQYAQEIFTRDGVPSHSLILKSNSLENNKQSKDP